MINNSGGAHGADTFFEIEGEKYGVKTIAYSFEGHNTKSKNRKILTEDELKEGFEHIKTSNKTLNRYIYNLSPYVKNLLSRNWYQVKNSEAIFAIGKLQNDHIVEGGTGWAIQEGIDNQRVIYVFDQDKNDWFRFSYVFYKFMKVDYVPELTENFAGIGTRDINENGISAIKELYKNKFETND